MKGNKLFKKIDRFIGIPIVFLLGILTNLWAFFFRPSSKPLSSGDNVLVVKLSALGDTFILLPVFKALKEKIGPTGKILMIATPINQAALKDFPYMDDVLLLDFGKLAKSPKALWDFLKKLRDFKAIFALDFDQWLRVSPLLCFLSGAASRYGFKTPGQHRHFLYQKIVTNEKNRHEFEQFASIAGLAGIDRSRIDHFNGFLKKENLYPTDSLQRSPSAETLIHIHPGCGESGWQRAWPENYYVELIKKLKSNPDIQIQMTGMGTYEENLVHQIIQESGQKIADFSGKLEIEQLSDLLKKSDLVICGNTGIMHLAVGLGCSLIAPHGPTNPAKWGPLPSSQPNGNIVSVLSATIACSPCLNLGFEYGCDARPCMESIPVEKVYQECVRLLGRTGKLKHEKIQ
jgi:heptosyltransferase I